MLYAHFLFLLVMLCLGSRYGGIGLGVISGIGLIIEVFIFKMPPTSPPISVMLITMAVVTCASGNWSNCDVQETDQEFILLRRDSSQQTGSVCFLGSDIGAMRRWPVETTSPKRRLCRVPNVCLWPLSKRQIGET